jgi:hypothetical protein
MPDYLAYVDRIRRLNLVLSVVVVLGVIGWIAAAVLYFTRPIIVPAVRAAAQPKPAAPVQELPPPQRHLVIVDSVVVMKPWIAKTVDDPIYGKVWVAVGSMDLLNDDGTPDAGFAPISLYVRHRDNKWEAFLALENRSNWIIDPNFPTVVRFDDMPPITLSTDAMSNGAVSLGDEESIIEILDHSRIRVAVQVGDKDSARRRNWKCEVSLAELRKALTYK